ncbi:MAG: copper(I)-binding protein [Porticoccus sp.]|jgi:copper(I)-binding protein
MKIFFSGRYLGIFLILVFAASSQAINASKQDDMGDHHAHSHGGVHDGAGQLTVSDGYIRKIPPGQKVTAAFMILQNFTDRACRVIGASTDIADRIEIHKNSYQNGIMSMRPVEWVELAPGKTVSFESGGYHLMLFGLKRELDEDEQHRVTLIFDRCPELSFDAKVRSIFHNKHHH